MRKYAIIAASSWALQDFPVELLHLVGRRCGFGAKPAIAVQVKGDALEEMPQIIDAEAAALEHLDLVVEPLDKAAALVMAEVVGDAIQPGVEQFQERVEAGQPTRPHPLAPGPYPADASRFRVRGIKDLAQFLAKVVRLFQTEAMGQEPIQAVLFVGFQIRCALAKGPEGVLQVVGFRLRQRFPQPREFLRAKGIDIIPIVRGHVEAVNHNGGVRQHLLHRRHIGHPHIGTDRTNLAANTGWDACEPGAHGRSRPIREDGEEVQFAVGTLRSHDHDVVSMALLERNFVDPEHAERWDMRPINLGVNPAIKHPTHGIGQGVLFLTDIRKGAVDQGDQQLPLVRLRVGNLWSVPLQLLSRGGMIIAERTPKALGADLDIHDRTQDWQMPQPDGPILAIRDVDSLATAPAGRGGQRALDRNDHLPICGHGGAQHPNIGEIQRDGNRRVLWHLGSFIRNGARCGGMIAPIRRSCKTLHLVALPGNPGEPLLGLGSRKFHSRSDGNISYLPLNLIGLWVYMSNNKTIWLKGGN